MCSLLSVVAMLFFDFVFSLMDGLGMFDPPISPPYASMIIIEMFIRDIDDKYFVRFSYRNETERDPYVLKLLDGACDEYCPLTKFDELTKPLRPVNW